MAEFIQNLDSRSLITLEATLSFIASIAVAPSYNLPIFLFGMYAQEAMESNHSLKLFVGLSSSSLFFDIIWLARHEQNWFIRIISIIILILKLPTSLSALAALRQRGEQFSGLGIRSGDISGPTVWSMPGGFSSLGGGRSGYETVDDEPDSRPRPPGPPAVHVTPPQQPPAPPASGSPGTQAPGGYQAV